MHQSSVFCLKGVDFGLQLDDLIIVYLVKLLLLFFYEILGDPVEGEPIPCTPSSFYVLAGLAMISALDVLGLLW